MPTGTAVSTARRRLELADVVRAHGDAYRRTHRLVSVQRRALHAIETCRTATLGGHRETCDRCGAVRITYNIRKVALWLGHSHLTTTEMYVRADPTEKLEAIEAIVPPSLRKGTFRPTDSLIAWLKASR